MYVIKSTSDENILFDEKEILILNNQYITKQQRFIIAIIGILIAIIGIIFHYREETLFFFIAYILLLVVWGGYFIGYLIKKKDPEIIKYDELTKIEVKSSGRKIIIKLFIKDRSDPFKITTKQIDENFIEFLKKMNLKIIIS